jgi:transposase
VKGERATYRTKTVGIDVRRYVFIDETGVNTAMARRYGRAPRGKRAIGSVPKNWGKNVTILGAMRADGVSAMMTVEGATDTDVFWVFVHEVLVPSLRVGDVVVMDNLGAHTSAWVERAIEAAGARVIYLPPYSPDFNPIEQCWSKIKTFLRAAKARTREALDDAITRALRTITADDAAGWFTHAGYPVQ